MFRPMSRVTAAVAATAGAAVVLAGCGGSGGGGTPANPRTELQASVTHLSDAGTLTTTLRLEATPAELQSIAKSSGDTLNADTANAISSAQLVIEEQKSGGHTSSSIRAVDGGKTLFELRSVSDTLYLQGDINGILTLAHKPGALAEFQAHASQLPQFVGAFLADKWISLNAGALSALGGQFGAGGASTNPSQGPKMLAELKGVLGRDVTVARVGSDSRGDHLRLTGDTRKLAADLRSTIADSVPGGSALTDRLGTGQVPSKAITLDAWVKDGALTELSLDLAQFAPKGQVPAGTHLPITLTFEQSGAAIAAPAGATPVDLTQLGSLMGALTPGAMSGASASSSSSSSVPAVR